MAPPNKKPKPKGSVLIKPPVEADSGIAVAADSGMGIGADSSLGVVAPSGLGLGASSTSGARPSGNRSSGIRTSTMRYTSRIKQRKPSFGYSRISGIKTHEKLLQYGDFKRPALIYMNTYQLEPRVRFDPKQVVKIIEELLDDWFTDHVYYKQESPALALCMSGELTRRVKSLNFDRYRILSIVTIGQKRAQGYHNAVAFLWDDQRDNYADVSRETHSAFIQVTIFGIYLD